MNNRQLRARSKMNTIGPVLVYICLLFNLYAVIYFYAFPLRSLLDSDMAFILIYFLLFFMTLWSFIAASCTDPGYVPRDLTDYDKAKLSKRELLLWNYIENLGLDPNNDSIQQENSSESDQDGEDNSAFASADSKDPLQFLVTHSVE